MRISILKLHQRSRDGDGTDWIAVRLYLKATCLEKLSESTNTLDERM